MDEVWFWEFQNHAKNGDSVPSTQMYASDSLVAAAWSSLGRWIWNMDIPGSNLPPYHYVDLFSVALSSSHVPRWVKQPSG